ncbi:MAG: hypothetical protein U1F10_00305 [Burkholderiales bacterium]
MSTPTKAVAAALALTALALAACATPDPQRAATNEARQEALQQMESQGQRNDDRPVRVQ